MHTNWERRQVSHIDFRRFRSIHSLIHRDLRYLLLLVIVVAVVGVVIVVVFMYSN